MSQAGQYRPELSDQYLQDRWSSRVRSRALGAATPSEDPVMVLLGGQPGAGKTRATKAINQDDRFHVDQQLTVIEGDAFRQYHPDYRAVMERDRLQMPEVTAQAAGRWTGMAVDEALRMRASIIVEGTWRNASVPMSGVENAAQHGYRVHAVALAVPPEQSRLDAADRFYDAVRSGRAARWTPSSAHDQAVANLPGTVRAVAGDQRVDRFTVMDRSGEVLFDQADWSPDRGNNALSAFQTAAARSWTTTEAKAWLKRYGQLRELHEEHTPNHPDARATWTQLGTHDHGVVTRHLHEAQHSEQALRRAQAGFPGSTVQRVARARHHDPYVAPPATPRPDVRRAPGSDNDLGR